MKTRKELRMARNVAAVVAFTFGMAACTQSEEPAVAAKVPHTPVNVMAGVQGVQTRAAGIDAAGEGFNDDTEITILDKNGPSLKAVFTKTADGWTADNAMYWDDMTPDNGKTTYSFVGIYPKDASLTYKVKDAELLMAITDNQAAKAEAVAFDFKHVLSKFTVKVTADASFTSIDAPVITLVNIHESATFKYEANAQKFATFDLVGEATGVYASENPTNVSKVVTYEYLLPAQTITNVNFDATGLETYKYNGSVVLAQGKNTTLNLTLSRTGLKSESVTIDPWGVGDTESGTLN